jgi:nitrilase
MQVMVFKAACVQIQPIFLDVPATTDKICGFIEKAAQKGAKLVVFPELILSGYPNFRLFNMEYRRRYNEAAIYADGPELERVCEKAEDNGVVVVLGFMERDPDYREVIYDSSCVVDDDGSLVGTHRKIAPLGAEKMVFKQGDARDIRIFETSVGKIGVGLCFEHLNPLYRKALSLLGEDVHCALWVNSEDIKHIVDSSSRVTAVEGGTYVTLCSQVVTSTNHLSNGQDFLGGSGVLNPWGQFLSGPVFGREDVVYADVDSERWRVQMFQSRGVEARDDLLRMIISDEPYQALRFEKEEK